MGCGSSVTPSFYHLSIVCQPIALFGILILRRIQMQRPGFLGGLGDYWFAGYPQTRFSGFGKPFNYEGWSAEAESIRQEIKTLESKMRSSNLRTRKTIQKQIEKLQKTLQQGIKRAERERQKRQRQAAKAARRGGSKSRRSPLPARPTVSSYQSSSPQPGSRRYEEARTRCRHMMEGTGLTSGGANPNIRWDNRGMCYQVNPFRALFKA